LNYESVVKPYLDSKVDDLEQVQGQIDLLPTLNLDISDKEIIQNLNNRIEDSQGYWQEPKGYDLRAIRQKNLKVYLGKQLDEGQLYRFQIPYNENQVFKSTEAIVAYLTSQPPQPECYPATDSDQSRIMASHLEKGLLCWAQKAELERKLEQSIRNLLIKRVGILYFWFDPDYGRNGEIRVSAVNPDHVILDKNCEQGENPAFVCLIRKWSVEELIYHFPDKEEAILKEIGIQRKTHKQMSQTIAWRQVYVTHYVKGQPQEGCVSYFGSLVLSKYKDPNWLWSSPEDNFIDMPRKPFVFLNYINDGQHLVDHTTVLEQASWIQEVLNKRGRQIMENADTANGFMVLSSDAISVDDAENLTGDPNQKLVIDTNGQPISSMVANIEGRDLPSYVVEDKQDLRTTIGDIMGVPSQFAGSENNQTDTLGQAIMIKNQASGRQDLIVRCVDKAASLAYEFVAQMMVVHYTEKHYMTMSDGDGQFDYIVMHRHSIEPGASVRVKAGSSLPYDKSREEAITLNLVKDGLLSPLDVYKGLHMPNPQKLYDNWAKYKTDPMSLARDALSQLDDTEAYIEYVQIMDGRKVEPKEDATINHILAHRKQMITEEFLDKAKKSKKIFKAMMDLVTKEVNSLQLRTDLDQMSQMGAEALLPSNPPQPTQPPMGPGGPAGPGGPTMGIATPPGVTPGVMAPPGVNPMGGGPGGPPGAGGPVPPPGPLGQPPAPPPGGAPGIQNIMNGTQAPPNLPTPANPTSMPVV
jgi:hypothetical protein